MIEPVSAPNRARVRGRLLDAVTRTAATNPALGTGVALLLLGTYLSFASPYFLTEDNIRNILLEASTLSIIAAGMTITLISAEIDLSVGSVEALTGSLIAVLIVDSGVPVLLAVLIGLMAAATCGFVSGFFSTRYELPSFVTTLAMLGIAQGFAFVVTEGEAVQGIPSSVEWLGQGELGPIPAPVAIAALILLILNFILTRTEFGVRVYAVGGNAEAARLVGINVRRVKLVVLLLSASLAGVAGLLLSARLGSGAPNVAGTDLLDAVAAAVIGGTSLFGGSGRITGTIMGVLLIATIRNGLILLGVQSYWQQVAIGALILAAVLVDHALKEAARKRGQSVGVVVRTQEGS